MLTQIIGVGAIDDRVESKLRSNLVEPGPELGFTVVAPVDRITEVTRIGQLVGIDLPQWDVELARDLMHRRVHAPGVAEDDAAEHVKVRMELLEFRHGRNVMGK